MKVIDSVYKKGKSCYTQVHLEECKYMVGEDNKKIYSKIII